MNVWYAFPSATKEAAQKTIDLWKSKGYKVIVLTDGDSRPDLKNYNFHLHMKKFVSWGDAQNRMAEYVLSKDQNAAVVIAGSDDVEPDMDKDPQEIAGRMQMVFGSKLDGVMQPTGDEYGSIHKCAPHPWVGIGYIRRGGRFFAGYHHLYTDQEYRDVAVELNRYVEFADVVQYHRHWGRQGEKDNLPKARRSYIKRNQKADKALYHERRLQRYASTVAPSPINGQRFCEIADGKRIVCRKTQFLLQEPIPKRCTTLILHNSDKSLTRAMVDKVPAHVQTIAAANCEPSGPRILALPLGLINSTDLLWKLRFAKNWHGGRSNLVYLNAPWNVPNAAKKKERQSLYAMFDRSWTYTVNRDGQRGVPFEKYYEDLANSAYCFSPRGAGIDCHRTWEAMYLGCIPIVRRHKELEPFVEIGLPILMVDDWEEVTEDLLNKKMAGMYDKFRTAGEKLTFNYWNERIFGCTE